jgi:hypothetical protein
MTVASDTVATAGRVDTLRQYMTEHVLGSSGNCICRRLGSCQRSVLFDQRGTSRPDAAFAAGQLSHVGHHYDLLLDGSPTRTLVVAMETGRPRAGVTLTERHAEVMRSASLAFTGRNAHMQGVTSAGSLSVVSRGPIALARPSPR